MTRPELEAFREKLIQTALTIAFAIEDIDKILIPTGPELNPPKPVRWGKSPTQETADRIVADIRASGVTDRDDDDHDPNEGRYDRQD